MINPSSQRASTLGLFCAGLQDQRIDKVHLRAFVRQMLLRATPRMVAEAAWVRSRSHNVLFRAVDTLVSRGDVALDVGAADGVFSARMLPLVGSRGRVCAFEPNPYRLGELESLKRHGLEIFGVALSDRAGIATLRVPVRDGRRRSGMGSLELPQSKDGEAVEEVRVTLARLADLLANLTRLDFIKCDVEGHERSVLAGALPLLERHQPTVLIEIEQRHQDRSVNETFMLFDRLGYSGWAFFHDGLHPIADFDLQRDQIRIIEADPLTESPPPGYVHNFLFTAPSISLSGLLAP